MLAIFKQTRPYYHALRLLVARDLSSRYKGTMLGLLWLIVQPAMMVIVYSFVFSVIMKVRIPGGIDDPYYFAVYLMAAMMPFNAFQEALMMASNVLSANRALLKKSTVPPVLLPLVPILSTVITETIALLIVITAVAVLFKTVAVCLYLLPLLILTRLVISLALGYFIAVLAVFLPDLKQALGFLLTLLMFLTPIVYPVDMIPPQFALVNHYNPFFHLLDAYRSVILKDQLPGVNFYWVAALSWLLLYLGVSFFQKTVIRAKDFV